VEEGAEESMAALAPKKRDKRRGAGRSSTPAAPWSGRFNVDELGTWHMPVSQEEGEARPIRLCDPLHIDAIVRDEQGGGSALLLRVLAYGREVKWLMPLTLLASKDGAGWRGELLSRGFFPPADVKRRGLLAEYLQSRRPGDLPVGRVSDRLGWHGHRYLMTDHVIGGRDGDELLIHQGSGEITPEFRQQGSLQAWQDQIGRLCIDNTRLVFAVATALAAPLLGWVDSVTPGGFNFVGRTGQGKTVTLRVAGSVWGGPGYLCRWRATETGVENLAVGHHDALLVLDELKEIAPAAAGAAAYMLANGQGKARGGKEWDSRGKRWRLLFLSSGELSLEQHMQDSGQQLAGGQEVRMCDLPVDTGSGFFAFDCVHGWDSSASFAQHLEAACSRVHGAIGREWLHVLANESNGLRGRLGTEVAAIEAMLVPEGSAVAVRRAARRFALVAVAGEWATAAGLTGWPEGEARRAVRRVFNDWLAARPAGVGDADEERMLRLVRAWFGQHGESRFSDWSREPGFIQKTQLRAGWRRRDDEDDGEGTLWFVLPDVFRVEVAKGFPHQSVLKLLADRGHLKREGKHYAARTQPPGEGKMSLYRISSSLLDDLHGDL